MIVLMPAMARTETLFYGVLHKESFLTARVMQQ